jgi:hypothetical protein
MININTPTHYIPQASTLLTAQRHQICYPLPIPLVSLHEHKVCSCTDLYLLDRYRVGSVQFRMICRTLRHQETKIFRVLLTLIHAVRLKQKKKKSNRDLLITIHSDF